MLTMLFAVLATVRRTWLSLIPLRHAAFCIRYWFIRILTMQIPSRSWMVIVGILYFES